jgi:hypothetical protein
MTDIRIKVEDDIRPYDALCLVARVVSEGFISESAGRPHYCWATVFPKIGAAVVVARKRRDGAADSFVVYRQDKS